ncbi:putative membrane protein [Rhodopirellula maiorica SM1]|uniref:Putative membrane protein n=1 Tax=Rhodopirellula maiorica SM1 TaxID=1265738 RepID=M5RBE8_9BACT|nr:hypothetical protein [Rhodopirellula maiorica]EMI16793.1 putative membrane protein [Rhodopirellula maiorica SM1]
MRSKVAKAASIAVDHSAHLGMSPLKSNAGRFQYGVQWLAVVCLSVVFAFQPFSADDFWWQLSRGREVAGGSITPSRSLLTQETLAEADWLGGLPIFAVYQFLGGHGLMMCRVLLISGCIGLILAPRRSSGFVRPLAWFVVTLALIAVARHFELTPTFFDCLAMVVLVGLMHRKSEQADASPSDRRKPISPRVTAIGMFIVWSNLALGILVGLIVWIAYSCVASLVRETGHRRNWILAILMLVGGCINPRGVFAWTDSLSSIFPVWRNPSALFAGTPWQPLFAGLASPAAVSFLLLTMIWIATQTFGRRRMPRGLFCFAWMQWLAWSSMHNLAIATTWIAADLLVSWHRDGQYRISNLALSRSHWLGYLAAAMGIAVALPYSGLVATMGWGIDASLDNRMLQLALQQTEPYGTAFADDTRSGGMLAWQIPQLRELSDASDAEAVRLQDVAHRAVIAGRFAEHHRVIDDLRQQRLMSYWLSDGSQGGYWLTLEHRETTLLLVSNRDTELIRGLEPSIWKPLSLDSPVIPYAAAGDKHYADQMIETLTNREIVEFQNWQYSFPRSSSSLFDRDRWGFAPIIVDADQAYRQSEVFRAMGLRYAALRVLFVGRQAFPESVPLACAMTRCQTELANAEIVAAGAPSWFRYFAASEPLANGDCSTPMDIKSVAEKSSLFPRWAVPESNPFSDELRRRVAAYLQEGPQTLMVSADFQSQLGVEHSQLMYAGLCGAIEAGEHEIADRYLQWFESNPAVDEIKRLVEVRESELHPSQTSSDEF